MDAHNLSVCVAPNLFQTKQNCKVIQQQNAAVEICIKNVLNIGEWLLSAWSTYILDSPNFLSLDCEL